MSAFAFLVCYSLVPGSVLGSWRQAVLPGRQQRRIMKERKVTEGKPVLDTTQSPGPRVLQSMRWFAVLIGDNNVFPRVCGLWASNLVEGKGCVLKTFVGGCSPVKNLWSLGRIRPTACGAYGHISSPFPAAVWFCLGCVCECVARKAHL